MIFSARSAGDVAWSARRLALQLAAGVRVHAGLGAARLLRRKALVLVGDSRFAQMGMDAIDPGERQLVPAAFAGATARFWSAGLRGPRRGRPPVLFAIWLGVNDVVNEGASGAQVVRRLRAISEHALGGSDDRVLLVEQIPTRLRPSAEAARVDEELRAVNRGLAQIADRDARVWLLPLWARFEAAPDCMSDAVHLNERGNAFLRALLAETLLATWA
jgi:hypothetical protein